MRQLSDSAGQIPLAQSYEPYGDVLSSAGTSSSNYGYTGEWTDGTELVHLRARYLNTDVGRFFTKDTLRGVSEFPQSLNRYSYVNSNVLNATDPSGYACFYGQDVWPLGLEPCTAEEIAYWNAYFSGVGNYIGGVVERSENAGINPIVGAAAETALITIASTGLEVLETEFAQNPIRQADVIFGDQGSDLNRLSASCSVFFSTGLPTVRFIMGSNDPVPGIKRLIFAPLGGAFSTGTTTYLNPNRIRFTQSSISNDGGNYTVEGNIEWLEDKNNQGWDLPVPPIRIFKKIDRMDTWPKMTKNGYTGSSLNLLDNHIYTLDNRRLYAYKMAGRTSIPVVWLTDINVGGIIYRNRFKFSTTNFGGYPILLK